MHYYFTTVSLIAGICLGFGLLYLFIGLRRKDNKPLNLTFALFAFCYSATLLNGIRWYTATNVDAYITASRQDALFVAGAFIGLIWYIAIYTGVRPRVFLIALTTLFLIDALVLIGSPPTYLGEVSGLGAIELPWGESLVTLTYEGSIWFDTLLIVRLVTLCFIIYALTHQFLRGERQLATVLALGMLPFIFGVFYEILGEGGLVPYIPFGELGFLGIAIAAALQMTSSVIHTEEALADHRQNLKALVDERTAALEAAQEELLVQAQEQAVTAERSRLARDLHDIVTQILFSINLIATSLPRLWKQNPRMAERNTEELLRLSRGAMAEMRVLLRELRPQTIIATDLSTLLAQLGSGLSARHDIPVDVDVEETCDLPPDVHVTFYRIAQEAMNNVAKHAEASQVALYLGCDHDIVRLKITDDGQGFDTASNESAGMGLGIMRERAEAIGGELTIQSRPGAGATLVVMWPFDQ